MKKEKHKRATEVTTLVSGYLIPPGHPEKCAEYFLELLPRIRQDTGVFIHQFPSSIG